MSAHDEDLWPRIAANRRRAADLLADLDDAGWRTQSLCGAWTVQDLAGHLLMPIEASFPRAIIRTVLARGDFDRVTDAISRELATAPRDELVRRLRDGADVRRSPPFVGALGPMVDSCIHLRDAARPLGSPTDAPIDDWRIVLDFLVGPKARTGFVPRGRLDGLALRATDQEWVHGSGREVAGPSEALAMAAAGRPAALAELTGPGMAVLGDRLSRPRG